MLGSGVMVGAGLFASSFSPAFAQTQPSTTDPAAAEQPGLFSPSPAGGNLLTPGFRPGSATAASEDGRTVFRTGANDTAPPGSGPATTAATGFDSKNTRKPRVPQSLTQRQQEAARLRKAPQPATLVPGTNPAATPLVVPGRFRRRGGPDVDQTSRLNVPVTAVIPRRFPRVADDPFAPLGVRAGAFTLRPAIEIKSGYDTNPTRVAGLAGSGLTQVSPELLIRSDWQRHALNADLRGSYTWYGQNYGLVIDNPGTVSSSTTPENIDRPTMDSRVNGRFDVSSLSRFEGEARAVISTDAPGSPNVQTGLKYFPLVTTVGATLGYVQQFNRLEVTAKTLFDHQMYTDSHYVNGMTANNGDREYNQYGGSFRLGYELKPGLKPFVETGANTRIHTTKIDRNGYDRDSDGTYVKAGTTFEFTSKLVGEASLGWLWRFYVDPALTDMSGWTIDGALTYTLSDLTTVKLIGTTYASEIIVPGVSGVFNRDVALQVDHAFRRWLIGTVRFGTGIDDYVGSDRLDHRYFMSFAMLYKLSREIQLKSEVRQDWLNSNQPGLNWNATQVTMGVRLQR